MDDPCSGNGVCSDTGVNSYSCDCDDGYTFASGTCEEIFPCVSTELSNCDTNALCNHEGPGDFSCTCDVGYSGDGVTCVDTNGCAESPCFDGVVCHDQSAPEEGFVCDSCPDGFNGDVSMRAMRRIFDDD